MSQYCHCQPLSHIFSSPVRLTMPRLITWARLFAVRKTQATGSPRLCPEFLRKLAPRAESYPFHLLASCSAFVNAELTDRYHTEEQRRYSSVSAHSPLLISDPNLIDYKSCPPQFPPSSTVKNLNYNASQHRDSSFPVSFDPATVAVYPNVCSEIEEESLIQDLNRLFQRWVTAPPLLVELGRARVCASSRFPPARLVY
jgi:hypothetical protein